MTERTVGTALLTVGRGTASTPQKLEPSHLAFIQPECPSRILRLPDVIARVGLRRASIYLHMRQGSFPKPIALGIRAVGWLESEIDAWVGARIEARKPSPRP